MNKFLFYLSARLFGEACLELYIHRFTPDGKEQVYLIPRPDNDPFYPSMMHMPGVRKLPTETDEQHLIRAMTEVDFDIQGLYYKYATSTTVKAKRGTEFADIRSVRVPYDENQTGFYDVDNLPDNLIEHQRVFIDMVKK